MGWLTGFLSFGSTLWIFDALDDVRHGSDQVVIVGLLLLLVAGIPLADRPAGQRREGGQVNLWRRGLDLLLGGWTGRLLVPRLSHVPRVPAVLDLILPPPRPPIAEIGVDTGTS
jgi:hypothetical protein